MATGDPRVRPWRTPPTSVTSSRSNRIRGPRPKPRRRRASSPWISSTVIGSPAGRPSTTTTSARPCDSPAVRKRSTPPIVPVGLSTLGVVDLPDVVDVGLVPGDRAVARDLLGDEVERELVRDRHLSGEDLAAQAGVVVRVRGAAGRVDEGAQ